MTKADKDSYHDFLAQEEAKRHKRTTVLRGLISDAMVKFEKEGGKITVIPTPEYKPRQPSKKTENPWKKKQKQQFFNHRYNVLLREWCDAGKQTKGRGNSRHANLSRLSGLSETWISYRKHGVRQLLLVDYEYIKPFMDQIAEKENEEQLAHIIKKHSGAAHEQT